MAKNEAYALTWDAEGTAGVAPVDGFADVLLRRLTSDRAGRVEHARRLAGLARAAGERMSASFP